MTDAEFDVCMSRIVKADKNALKEIYNEYLKYIYSIVYTLVQNKENAEDISSEFFIKLWSNAEKYKKGQGHKAYMATIARNMSIDFLRKYKKEKLIAEFESECDDEYNYSALSAKEQLLLSENKSLESQSFENRSFENTVIDNINLKEAISRLKPKEREIINMKIMGDMTFQEIADVLKKPIGTISWQYRKALDKLRSCGYE